MVIVLPRKMFQVYLDHFGTNLSYLSDSNFIYDNLININCEYE